MGGEDQRQGGFVYVGQEVAAGKEIQTLRAFLYKVLRNVTIDEIKRKKPLSLDELSAEGFSPEGEDGREMAERIDAKDVLKKLSLLEEPYREAIQLRFIDDLSISEIAEILEEKDNTVSVRIHRGIEKLRNLMTDGLK